MNARFRMALVGGAAVAVIAIGVGCGSDGSSTSASGSDEGGSSSASKAVFVKQANAACFKGRENTLARVGPYKKKYGGQGLSEAALAKKAIKAAVLETIRVEIAALSKLQVPAGDEKEVEGIMVALNSALDKAEKSNTKTSLEVEHDFLAADKKLRAYGLTGCTKNA